MRAQAQRRINLAVVDSTAKIWWARQDLNLNTGVSQITKQDVSCFLRSLLNLARAKHENTTAVVA